MGKPEPEIRRVTVRGGSVGVNFPAVPARAAGVGVGLRVAILITGDGFTFIGPADRADDVVDLAVRHSRESRP
jgi:hypothetical protein